MKHKIFYYDKGLIANNTSRIQVRGYTSKLNSGNEDKELIFCVWEYHFIRHLHDLAPPNCVNYVILHPKFESNRHKGLAYYTRHLNINERLDNYVRNWFNRLKNDPSNLNPEVI